MIYIIRLRLLVPQRQRYWDSTLKKIKNNSLQLQNL
jgi:hypothetical protein